MISSEAKTFRTKDGRGLTFLFDIDGLIAAENIANAALMDVVAGAAGGRLGHLVALVVGGLKARQPDITRPAAFDLIESDGIALGEALWPALFSAMPEAKGEANPRKARSGTGTRSSPPGSKKASPKKGSASRRRAASR